MFNKLWGYIAAAGVGIALLLGVRQSGKTDARNESMEKSLEAVRKRNEVENTIDGLSDADVADQLRKNGWYRQ